MADAAKKPAFTVGQVLYRQKAARHYSYEGDVTVVSVGRKWVAVKAVLGGFEGRFDLESMFEDNKGFGSTTGRYWLSKDECEAARAVNRAWDGLTSRFRDAIRLSKPANIGLAEIAQIEAILEGRPIPSQGLPLETAKDLIDAATDLLSEVHAHLDANDDDDMQQAYDALKSVVGKAEKAMKGECRE
jgi:hypothetical protein